MHARVALLFFSIVLSVLAAPISDPKSDLNGFTLSGLRRHLDSLLHLDRRSPLPANISPLNLESDNAAIETRGRTQYGPAAEKRGRTQYGPAAEKRGRTQYGPVVEKRGRTQYRSTIEVRGRTQYSPIEERGRTQYGPAVEKRGRTQYRSPVDA